MSFFSERSTEENAEEKEIKKREEEKKEKMKMSKELTVSFNNFFMNNKQQTIFDFNIYILKTKLIRLLYDDNYDM